MANPESLSKDPRVILKWLDSESFIKYMNKFANDGAGPFKPGLTKSFDSPKNPNGVALSDQKHVYNSKPVLSQLVRDVFFGYINGLLDFEKYAKTENIEHKFAIPSFHDFMENGPNRELLKDVLGYIFKLEMASKGFKSTDEAGGKEVASFGCALRCMLRGDRVRFRIFDELKKKVKQPMILGGLDFKTWIGIDQTIKSRIVTDATNPTSFTLADASQPFATAFPPYFCEGYTGDEKEEKKRQGEYGDAHDFYLLGKGVDEQALASNNEFKDASEVSDGTAPRSPASDDSTSTPTRSPASPALSPRTQVHIEELPSLEMEDSTDLIPNEVLEVAQADSILKNDEEQKKGHDLKRQIEDVATAPNTPRAELSMKIESGSGPSPPPAGSSMQLPEKTLEPVLVPVVIKAESRAILDQAQKQQDEINEKARIKKAEDEAAKLAVKAEKRAKEEAERREATAHTVALMDAQRVEDERIRKEKEAKEKNTSQPNMFTRAVSLVFGSSEPAPVSPPPADLPLEVFQTATLPRTINSGARPPVQRPNFAIPAVTGSLTGPVALAPTAYTSFEDAPYTEADARSLPRLVNEISMENADGITWNILCHKEDLPNEETNVYKLIDMTMKQFVRRFGIRLEAFCRIRTFTTIKECLITEADDQTEHVYTLLGREDLKTNFALELHNSPCAKMSLSIEDLNKQLVTQNGLTRLFSLTYSVRVRATRLVNRRMVQKYVNTMERIQSESKETKAVQAKLLVNVKGWFQSVQTRLVPFAHRNVPKFMTALYTQNKQEYFFGGVTRFDKFVTAEDVSTWVNVPEWQSIATYIAALFSSLTSRQRFFIWYAAFHILCVRPMLETLVLSSIRPKMRVSGEDPKRDNIRSARYHIRSSDVFTLLTRRFVSNLRLTLDNADATDIDKIASVYGDDCRNADKRTWAFFIEKYKEYALKRAKQDTTYKAILDTCSSTRCKRFDTKKAYDAEVCLRDDTLDKFNVIRGRPLEESALASMRSPDPYTAPPFENTDMAPVYFCAYLRNLDQQLNANTSTIFATEVQSSIGAMNRLKSAKISLRTSAESLHLWRVEPFLEVVTVPGVLGLESPGANQYLALQCMPPTTSTERSVLRVFCNEEKKPIDASVLATVSNHMNTTGMASANTFPKLDDLSSAKDASPMDLLLNVVFPWVFATAFRVSNAFTADTVRPSSSDRLYNNSVGSELHTYMNQNFSLARYRDSAHGERSFLSLFWFTASYIFGHLRAQDPRSVHDDNAFRIEMELCQLMVNNMESYEEYHRLLLQGQKDQGFLINWATQCKLECYTPQYGNKGALSEAKHDADFKTHGEFFTGNNQWCSLFPFTAVTGSKLVHNLKQSHAPVNTHFSQEAFQSFNFGALSMLNAVKPDEPIGNAYMDYKTLALLTATLLLGSNQFIGKESREADLRNIKALYKSKNT